MLFISCLIMCFINSLCCNSKARNTSDAYNSVILSLSLCLLALRSNVTVDQARPNDWCLRTVVSQES